LEKAEWDQAGQHLEKTREECERFQLAIPTFYVHLDLIRFSRYQGDRENGEKWLARAQEKSGGRDSQKAQLLAERGLLEASWGEYDRAEQTVRDCLALSRKLRRKREEFLAQLACTWINVGRGREKEAARALRRALRLAKAKGYDGIVGRELRCSPVLAGFGAKAVRGSLGTGMQRDYIRDILRGCGVVDMEGPGATKNALRVQLFGALQVSLPDGKEVPLAWRSLKSASLFSYLLLHRSRVCDREELIGALWPKAKLKQGEQSLYAWVFQLKKALASGFLRAGARALARRPFIVHREKGYRIDPSFSFRVDVEEFLSQWESAKSLAEEGKREESEKAYRHCEKLYQGPFLSALGERWCEERRGEYEKVYLSCLRRLAAGRMEKKDYEEAVLLYHRYLHSEPLSEEVRIELWKALKAAGRRADIQKDYKELQQLLRRDFGEEPQAGTREAFRDLFGTRTIEV
jgi:two-component SAPR family response regulator